MLSSEPAFSHNSKTYPSFTQFVQALIGKSIPVNHPGSVNFPHLLRAK